MIVAGIRVFLGLIFFTSGMAKLFAGHAFPGVIGPVWLETALAPHGLALFARFVAYSQITAGFLLLTRRFATLGAIILVPLLANILVVTISLQWRGTPYVNAFLLFLNLVLLWADREKLLALLPRLELRREALFAGGVLCVWIAPAASRVHLAAGYAAAFAGFACSWLASRNSQAKPSPRIQILSREF